MTVKLPIFPLPGAILFPGLQLPLHIFEERYREMLIDIARGGKAYDVKAVLHLLRALNQAEHQQLVLIGFKAACFRFPRGEAAILGRP